YSEIAWSGQTPFATERMRFTDNPNRVFLSTFQESAPHFPHCPAHRSDVQVLVGDPRGPAEFRSRDGRARKYRRDDGKRPAAARRFAGCVQARGGITAILPGGPEGRAAAGPGAGAWRSQGLRAGRVGASRGR